MKKLLPAAILAALLAASCPAAAGTDPAEFDAPQAVGIQGYDGEAMEPFISRDGTTLFFNNLNEPWVNTDIFYAVKTGPLTFEYKGPVEGVNTAGNLEGVPSMDRDGNFYFISPRSYGTTRSTIYTGKYADGAVTGAELAGGNLSLNAPLWFSMDAEISADGKTLYATDNHKPLFGGAPDASNFFVAARYAEGRFVRQLDTAMIMRNINAYGVLQYAASISADDLTFYFTRADRRGGDVGIYVATRIAKGGMFTLPRRIAAITGFAEAPAVTPDGCGIYFHRRIGGHHSIWYAHRTGCAAPESPE